MGDLADDCYDAAMREMYSFAEHVTDLMSSTSNQQVVDHILNEFREQPVDEKDASEKLAKDILITTARTKTLSQKQKRCLLNVLVERCVEGYECDYSF